VYLNDQDNLWYSFLAAKGGAISRRGIMNIIRATRLVPWLALATSLCMAPAMAQTAAAGMVPVQTAAAAPAAGHGIKSAAGLPKSDEFTTLAAAAAHCPDSTVAWSSLSKSHNFHTSASRYFGKTKHGAYVCESDALAAGFHQAKS
jgi:hypothetical protein